MQIRFPRRIQMGFRPWYGLTLRQLGYLMVAALIAGAIVLIGPVAGSDVLVRVLIGLTIIGAGVGLAFFRKDGLSVEQWLISQVKFLLRPHKRVWTRTGDGSPRDQVAEILIDGSAQAEQDGRRPVEREVDAPFAHPHLLQPDRQGAATTHAIIVLIDLAMLLALFSLAVYLSRGGLGEIQAWSAMQIGR